MRRNFEPNNHMLRSPPGSDDRKKPSSAQNQALIRGRVPAESSQFAPDCRPALDTLASASDRKLSPPTKHIPPPVLAGPPRPPLPRHAYILPQRYYAGLGFFGLVAAECCQTRFLR